MARNSHALKIYVHIKLLTCLFKGEKILSFFIAGLSLQVSLPSAEFPFLRAHFLIVISRAECLLCLILCLNSKWPACGCVY